MPGHPNASPIYGCRGLIACPPYESSLANPNFEAAVTDTFEAGVFPNGWMLEGVSLYGKRISTGGFRGANYYRLFPPAGIAASPSLLYRFTPAALSATFGDLRPGTDYRINCAAACASAGGGKLRLRLDLFSAGPVLMQSVFTDVILGTLPGLPADSVWRMCRSLAVRLTPSQAAKLSYAELRLICMPVAATYSAAVDLRLDFVALGAFLDTNELGRCAPEDPVEIDEEGQYDDEISTARTGFRASFHTTQTVGIFQVTGVQPGGEREATNLLRAAGGGRPMSVMYDLANLARDYYPLTIHEGENDGVEMGVGAYSDVSVPFRTTVAP